MREYLVITALGADRPGVVNDLSETILETGCNIDDSRMMLLGGEFAIILMLSGDGEAVEKLNNEKEKLEEKTGLKIISKLTQPRETTSNLLLYDVEITSMDEPGIVHHVTEFFSRQNINIQSLTTDSYAAAHTGTPMFSMKLLIEVPASFSVSKLKQEFSNLCDEYNFDGGMHAEK